MRIRNNLGNFYSSLGGSKNQTSLSYRVGRVYHVVTNEESSGYADQSSIGTVYVLDYTAPNPNIPLSSEEPLSNNDLIQAGLTRVKPLFPQFTYIPVLDEFVLIFSLPSPDSDESDKTDLYYLNTINLWLNSHHNSQGVYNALDNEGGVKIGEYIKPSTKVPNLLPLEGDLIINSRWGSGIRFSNTPDFSFSIQQNPWQQNGADGGSPITMIVNGYNSETPTLPYLENVDKDDSSIYLTSNQFIPASSFSPNFEFDPKPTSFSPALIDPNKYGGVQVLQAATSSSLAVTKNNSQIIVSSNRVTLNSAKDDIVMYATTNVEIGANKTIYLNSKENIHLNSKYIYLGKIVEEKVEGSLEFTNMEPVLLGYKTKEIINEFLSTMIDFTETLKTLDAGDPSYNVKISIPLWSSRTNEKLKELSKSINSLLSTTTFTS